MQENDKADDKDSAEAETLRKADVRKHRKAMKKNWDAEGDVDYYLTVVFQSAVENQEFMECLKIEKSIDMIRFDRLLSVLQEATS